MSNFSIKHPLFIVPFENDAEGRAEIEFFMSLLADSGIDCYFSDWKKKTEKAGRPECDPYMMFAAALLSFSLDGGRLREIESKCRYDIRFLYFMTKDKPSYATFCNLLNKCVLPNADAIFSRITATICRRMGIDPNSEVFVDGTKVEANANKYKFVWKPDRKMDRLLEKAESECAALGIHADGGIIGHVGRMTALVGLLEEKLASQKIDISSIQSGKGIRNPAEVKTYLRCLGHLRKMAVYQEQVEICGKNRNSYYKTDHDATAMCLKEDYYSGLGSNMHAGYNIQAAVSKGIIVSYYVSQQRSDYKTFPTLMERHKLMNGAYPVSVRADAGYGGVSNYAFLKEKNIQNYVKTSTWEGEISGKRPALYRLEDDGSVVCLFGKKAKEIDPPRRSRIAGSRFFEIKSCAGCPYRKYCKKAFKKKGRGRIFEINMEFLAEKKKAYANLLSPKGIEMRVNRSIQVEGTFGILKQDLGYDRFRRRGLEKASMEIMMTFLGLNIRKYLSYVRTGKNPDFWKAPEGLESEKPRKLSCKVKKGGAKKKKLEPNQRAKKSYKRKRK